MPPAIHRIMPQYGTEQEAHQMVGQGKTPHHSTLQSWQTFSVIADILRNVINILLRAQKSAERIIGTTNCDRDHK